MPYGHHELGPQHNVRPLVNRVPALGTRHVVDDLPELHGLPEATARVIRANFHQLAQKLEDMRAALAAMGVPITEKEK